MDGKSIEDRVNAKAVYGDQKWSFVDLRDFESETFLTLRYDNHGQAIHTHDPNQKKRKRWSKREKGGWTTWFVKIRKKK